MIASQTIAGSNLVNNTITATQIANHTITTTQISNTAGILGSQLSATAGIVPGQTTATAPFTTGPASATTTTTATVFGPTTYTRATTKPIFVTFNSGFISATNTSGGVITVHWIIQRTGAINVIDYALVVPGNTTVIWPSSALNCILPAGVVGDISLVINTTNPVCSISATSINMTFNQV